VLLTRSKCAVSVSSRLVFPLRVAIDWRALIYHGLFCEFFFRLTPRSQMRPLNIILKWSANFIAQLVMYSDLESDYINPIDLCNKINQVFSDTLLIYITIAHIL